jgi:hypothetical protein
VKPSIQDRWKGGILLIKVDQIGWSCGLERMSLFLETASGSWLGELLPGKHESGIPALVVERHPFGK